MKLALVAAKQEYAKSYIQFLREEMKNKLIKVGNTGAELDIAAGIVSCSSSDWLRADPENLSKELVAQAIKALEQAESTQDDLKIHYMFFEPSMSFNEYGEVGD